jgi:hypothetical protein
MISLSKLRARQAAMRARPRKARPWDHVNEDDAERFILRMRKMFEAGLSDKFIANALNLDPVFVQVLRNKRSTQG